MLDLFIEINVLKQVLFFLLHLSKFFYLLLVDMMGVLQSFFSLELDQFFKGQLAQLDMHVMVVITLVLVGLVVVAVVMLTVRSMLVMPGVVSFVVLVLIGLLPLNLSFFFLFLLGFFLMFVLMCMLVLGFVLIGLMFLCFAEGS